MTTFSNSCIEKKISDSQVKVTIVLVNWNGGEDTIGCIESISILKSNVSFSVLVIDNCSSDNSRDLFKLWCKKNNFFKTINDDKKFPDSRIDFYETYRCLGVAFCDLAIVFNKDNFGFAAANNIGYKFASQKYRSEYFWFLNNDTSVHKLSLQLLLDRMEHDPTIGICGSTLINFGSGNVVQAFGGVKYTLSTARGYHIGSGDLYVGAVDNSRVEDLMTYVSGASMFVRDEFIQIVGLMCEDYFLYNEEVDWAWRGRQFYRLGVETASIVFHKEGASIGTENAQRPASVLSDFYQTRNKLIFAFRYMPLFTITVWISLFARAIRKWISGNYSNASVMLQVLFGRRKPNPTWFKKG